MPTPTFTRPLGRLLLSAMRLSCGLPLTNCTGVGVRDQGEPTTARPFLSTPTSAAYPRRPGVGGGPVYLCYVP